MTPITSLVQNLNTAIIDLPEVESIRGDIRETITDAADRRFRSAQGCPRMPIDSFNPCGCSWVNRCRLGPIAVARSQAAA
jgi:hypothetical protein